MKKYIKIAINAILLIITCTSCLENGLDDLDTYTGKEITSIVGTYHRYYSSDIIDASGEQAVKQIALSISNTNIDTKIGTCTFDVAIPTNFPEAESDKVSAQNLVVILNISTASVIEPIGGAPKLGAPGDWSKPNQYRITAANGSKQDWTITLTLNK